MIKSYGKVYFVGAGPGDPQLLTIKAANILSQAEVVITDRLVSEEIIKEYVNPNAIIIPVGKQGRSDASTLQFEINDLIVQFAAAYNVVVRLKGGDVSLYSNILDELITVKEYNISYEIVPGITALSGASAYTGVPLTARRLASGVRILQLVMKHGNTLLLLKIRLYFI
jgi:siroheme synthase